MAFLRLFAAGELVPVDLNPADSERMAELVEQYADFPLGETAASLIAIAERLGVTKVATHDRRHFSPIQPRHTDALTLLPERCEALTSWSVLKRFALSWAGDLGRLRPLVAVGCSRRSLHKICTNLLTSVNTDAAGEPYAACDPSDPE